MALNATRGARQWQRAALNNPQTPVQRGYRTVVRNTADALLRAGGAGPIADALRGAEAVADGIDEVSGWSWPRLNLFPDDDEPTVA